MSYALSESALPECIYCIMPNKKAPGANQGLNQGASTIPLFQSAPAYPDT